MRNTKGQFIKGHKINLGKTRIVSLETRKKQSELRKGKFPKQLFLEGIQERARIARIGKKRNVESRLKMRESQIKIAKRGSESPLWRGGITPISLQIRHSPEMKTWRLKVFERDNYTCQICGVRNGQGKHVKLNADHIKPFSLFPELRFDIKNGRTLCLDCHKKTDTFAGRIRHKDFPSIWPK